MLIERQFPTVDIQQVYIYIYKDIDKTIMEAAYRKEGKRVELDRLWKPFKKKRRRA